MTNLKPYGTVLIKADQILNFLSLSTESQRLQQIADATNITKSTASKIINTLTLIGYVQKDPLTNAFDIGPTIIKYANKSLKKLEIKQIAQPYLEELQKTTTETVHLGIVEKEKIVYIAKIESNNPVTLYSKIGKTIPLYCSAMGKSILAEQTVEEIEQYLDENELIPKTENTITTKEAFLKEMQKTKDLGYAFDDAEHEMDVFCIGMSIHVNGRNFGAFSVSVPKYRITASFIKEMIAAMKKCRADIISELE